MSNIVLNSLTYVGEGLVNAVGRFFERSGGIAASFRSLTNQQNVTKDKINVLWKLTLPYVVAADSACGCTGEQKYLSTIVDVRLSFDKKLPQTDRDDALKQVQDLVASTTFENSVLNLTTQS